MTCETGASQAPSPYLLAERIDYQSLQTAPLFACEGPSPTTLERVWHSTEQQVANPDLEEPVDTRIKHNYLAARQVAEHSETASTRLQAHMFLATFDLLVLRGQKEPIEADDIKRSYRTMSTALRNNLEYYNDPGSHRLIAQMIAYCLIARRGDIMNIPFVASPREAQSPNAEQNHDLYTVDDNMTMKTAIHVQTLVRSSDSFLYTHNSQNFVDNNSQGLEAVTQRRQAEPKKPSDLIVAELIANEPDGGYPTDSPEAYALSALSERLIARLNNHRLKLLGLSTSNKVRSAIAGMAAIVLPRPGPPEVTQPPEPIKRRPITMPDRLFFFTNDFGKQFINPYTQAEYIPPTVLELQKIRQNDLVVGSLWKTVELGISTENPTQVRTVGRQAQDIANTRDSSGLERVGAAMLQANCELLALRAENKPPTRQDISESFYRMAQVLNWLQQYGNTRIDNNYHAGLRAEIISYCLVAYAADLQSVPYLGSRREDQSYIISANHDIYTLPSRLNASKTAAQIKLRYEEQRHKQDFGTPDNPHRTFAYPIYLTEVLQAQADKMQFKGKHGVGIKDAARLILRAASNDLSEHEFPYLQGFSSSIIDLLAKHRDFLSRKQKYKNFPYTTASQREYTDGLT